MLLRYLYIFTESNSNILGGFVSGYVISQQYPSVRIQLGSSTTFQCHFHTEGYCSIFWIKVPPIGAPIHIANVHLKTHHMKMFGEFKNNSRIMVLLNESNFSLSFLDTELADAATYICGMRCYDLLQFGNGSRLIVEDTAGEFDYVKANHSL